MKIELPWAKPLASWTGPYQNSFDIPVEVRNLAYSGARFFNTGPVTVELPETPTSNVQETQLKTIRLAEERMSRLAAFDTAEVAAGKSISFYLKGKRPLPKWAEWKIFPRSGCSSTWFCVFIPTDLRIAINDVGVNDRYWWPDVNGFVYCFRYEEDAQRFLRKHLPMPLVENLIQND